jgi:rubrerythrin
MVEEGEMPRHADTALVILDEAMGIEREGKAFYLKAAGIARDASGQGMFRTLAGEEQQHYDVLKRAHASLSAGSGWTPPAITPAPVNLARQLFPKGAKGLEAAVDPETSERDVLVFGLGIESKSFDLYRRSAEATADPLGRQMFESLASQEQVHFDMLMMRFESLFGSVTWQY